MKSNLPDKLRGICRTLFPPTSREQSRGSRPRRLDGPAGALARVDGFDKRRRRASCGVGRRRGHDGCRGNADRGAWTSWARLVFAAGRRVVCVGDRPASERRWTNDENPAALLTLASGVAIAEAVRAVTGLPAEIKWPNDVLIGGRKLAGILAEAAVQAGALQFIVIGFGVNLQPAAYPPELASRVTSIEAETARPADRALMLAEILAALGERYADLRAGRFDAILSAWRQLAPSLPGAPRRMGFAGGRRARARARTSTGTVRCWCASAISVERIIAGEIRWR